jgi:hypothetical protein
MAASSDKPDLDRVTPLREWYARVGIPARSGRRLFATGNGPELTQLTEKMSGVRERHHLAWLDRRRKSRRSESTEAPNSA